MRVCTHNWRTTEADLDELLDLILAESSVMNA
jgi:hypothetical protein